MLFTVFVERLLLSTPFGSQTSKRYAIAVQLLDYPLIVVRPSPEGDAAAANAQDTVHFKRGTAAVLDANEQELDFLVSHVRGTYVQMCHHHSCTAPWQHTVVQTPAYCPQQLNPCSAV
jgi:hypothetical protein